MTFDKRDQTWSSSGSREPDTVNNYDKDDATSNKTYMATAGVADKTVATFASQLTTDFTTMATSVAKYGGFYVSRYEVGAIGTSMKNKRVLTAATSDGTYYVKGDMWYGLYKTLRNNNTHNGASVSSHMIWGSQYDQIIRFAEEVNFEPQKGHTWQSSSQAKSGANSSDVFVNIYDLEGNGLEWTAQAHNTYNRVYRGRCLQ